MILLIKKIILLSLKIAVAITIFFGLERFCHKQTDGFMLHKVQSNLSPDPKWGHTPISQEEKEDLLLRLDQPFYYLKSGGQCYAFISEDKTTILKLFKLHHMRELNWVKKIKIPGLIDLGHLKIVRYRERRFRHIFGSCKIAYEEMKEQTGLLYSHLNKTNDLHTTVTICDKLGIYHKLDLDKTEFLVQKKADLVFEKFHTVMKENNVEVAHQCLDSLIDLFVTRYKKGIDDTDPVVRKNFGYIDNTAVEIDLGSYFINKNLKDPEVFKEKLLKEMSDFKDWIAIYYPILTSHLDEKIEEVLNKN